LLLFYENKHPEIIVLIITNTILRPNVSLMFLLSLFFKKRVRRFSYF